MYHQLRVRLLIGTAAILLTATLWMGRGNWLGVAAAQETRQAAEGRPLVLDRAAARVIENLDPVFSAIAMDVERGEVFMSNNNEAGPPSILAYPSQFPPTDTILEPRRRIAGRQSDLGLPCGLAISPQFQEMYTVSGDGSDLNVFPLDANGDVRPSRQLVVSHGSGGIFLDVKNDELFITTEHVNRITVHRRADQGEADPLRYIQGPSTGLADPHGVFVDTEKNEILTSNHGNWRKTRPGEVYALLGDSKIAHMRGSQSHPGIVEPVGPSTGKFLPPSITVHPRTAQGDVVPLRTIQGSRTRLNLPMGVSRDPVSGQILVANAGDDSVVFFDGNATGDVAPLRVLKGPATNLKSPTGVLIDPKHNELWVTSWENHATNVYPRTAEGNVAPLRVIRSAPKGSPLATLGRSGALAYDPRRKEILVPN